MLDLLRSRRSVRRYDDREVPDELVAQLKEAALRAPTSRNLDSRRLVFVRDAATLIDLSHAKTTGSEFLGEAKLGVVVCGDAQVSDTWIEDCSIAAIVIQLAAESVGLGSCWIQIRLRQTADGLPAEEHIRRALGLEESLRVECVLAVGYPIDKQAPRPTESLRWDSLTDA